MYSKALDVAAANGFAFIWTGFIDGLHGNFDRVMMERHWRNHPIIAEGNWNYDDMMDHKNHGTLAENLDMAIDWHANFIHFYMLSDTYRRAIKEQPGEIERGLKAGGLGYRLMPTELSWRESLPAGHIFALKQTWVNRNAGRLYKRHALKVYFTDEQGNEKYSVTDPSVDQSQWVRGETYSVMNTFRTRKNIAPGLYDVRIALVDSIGKPRIRLAIEGEDAAMRYRVGSIRILPPEGR
jgi:hypothetical protein